MITEGMKALQKESVTEKNTAQMLGSGGLAVYATPAMLLLMEKTCYLCVQDSLEHGQSTVGTGVSISHESATPLGGQVICTCELTAINGRELTFAVECRDEAGIIGRGEHKRFIIDVERFMERVEKKKNNV
jgi:predicted thioesterase